MSMDEVQASGLRFVRQVRTFYDNAPDLLGPSEPLDPEGLARLEQSLDPALEASEEVLREAGRILSPIPRGKEYEALSTAVLAAATLDAMLASEVARCDGELTGRLREPVSEELRAVWLAHLEEAGEPVLEPNFDEVVAERNETLRIVEQALGGEAVASVGGAGMDADRADSIARATDTTASLVNFSGPPSRNLTAGLMTSVTAGAFDVLADAANIDPTPGLQVTATALRKQSPRFLRRHVEKVVALRADARVLAEVVERVRRKMRAEELMATIAAADRADIAVQERINNAEPFTRETAESLNSDLGDLLAPFQLQTEIIGKAARWLRWGSIPFTYAVAPVVGHAVVAGVFVAGLGYVAYALADRIDARDLGIADRVEGVLRLVEARG